MNYNLKWREQICIINTYRITEHNKHLIYSVNPHLSSEPIGSHTKLQHTIQQRVVGSTTATRAAASSILHRGTTHVSLRSAAFRGTGRPLHRVGAGGLSGAGGVGGLLVDGRGDAGPVPAGAVLALGDLRVHGRDVAAAPGPRGLAARPALHLVAHGNGLAHPRRFPLLSSSCLPEGYRAARRRKLP